MGLAAVAALAVGAGIAGQAMAAPQTPTSVTTAVNSSAALFEDPMGQLMSREVTVADGPVEWRGAQTTTLHLSEAGAAIDSVRVSVGGVLRSPGGLPLNLDRADFDARVYEVSVVRDWPGAWRVGAGDYDLDVSPHAGVGVSNLGGQAEAGAVVRLGKGLDDDVAQRLGDIGVRDGASFGDHGRWYLFAAASGRAVGLNMLRSDDGWDRAGWSTDPSSALIGDAHVGIGYRRGAMQTSLGYVHREVKGQHMIFGQETRDDSMVAFSLSIKPRH
ncbi:MAG: DUF2219 family protein [Phenylobacterium sp.]|uniref:lipid A-modifier LpxR family protein n=1 Tax=Phenylobacterium sp. TaxID=1871053 RepID=UPI002735C12C|nr:lipid A-modifier LpxR family protein [Phenylobacterium sp.]MDP3175286.1 DUF2219 family protein [Phenylobacterium sp.]